MNTASTKPPRASGFWWALAGFGLGSLVSVGFNLQYAWLPAAEHGSDWAPSIASQAAAVVWSLSLIVSVEVLTRIAWPRAIGWKFVQALGILLVAGGSGVISYGHIHSVLLAWGYEEHQAIVGPLVVDGLMLISGFALVSIGRTARAVAPGTWATPDAPPAATEPPARPDPSVGRDTASSVTVPTPDTVTEEAPREASSPSPEEASREERTALHLVEPRTLPRAARRTSRTVSRPSSRPDALTDQEVFAAIAEHLRQEGSLPSANKLKTSLRIGADRAKDLLSQYQNDQQEVTA